MQGFDDEVCQSLSNNVCVLDGLMQVQANMFASTVPLFCLSSLSKLVLHPHQVVNDGLLLHACNRKIHLIMYML